MIRTFSSRRRITGGSLARPRLLVQVPKCQGRPREPPADRGAGELETSAYPVSWGADVSIILIRVGGVPDLSERSVAPAVAVRPTTRVQGAHRWPKGSLHRPLEAIRGVHGWC